MDFTALKNGLNLPMMKLKKQKEILGDSKPLVSESTIYEIIKSFKNRGILIRSKKFIDYLCLLQL